MSQTKAQLVAGTSDQTVAANTVTTTNIKNPSSGSNNIVLNADGTIGGACLTQTCRAWVNFNGTGTVAIRASYNVSSITDNGVGDYTVNFTTALADANYAFASGGKQNAAGAIFDAIFESSASTRTASALRVNVLSVAGVSNAGIVDASYVEIVVFR